MMKRSAAFAAMCVWSAAFGSDGLRVAAWNITNYTGGQSGNVQTAVYGSNGGNEFAPDVILLQEFRNQSAANSFASHLNNAAGSPGDWAAAPVFANSSINTGLVYRTSRMSLENAVLLWPGSTGANPRNIVRYDMRLAGYAGDDGVVSFYPTHMKAGSGSSDQARRQTEASRIVNDTLALPAGRTYVLGGDFNIQSSNQQAFRTLVGNTYNTGPFRDPISTPGTWNNNGSYRFIHTQDPATQVDDRHDMLLISPDLVDGVGAEYIGNFSTPWNLSTWNDPNHSYRCFGNDGSSYNQPINTGSNVSVTSPIAQALLSLASGLGHLPVYLDVRVPARTLVSSTTIDLGLIQAGTTPDIGLMVGSAGDTGLWGSAIEDTSFELIDIAGVSVPAGVFQDAAGGGLVDAGVTFTDTATAGPVSGSLIVMSNDGDQPSILVTVTGEVVAACSPADLDGDGQLLPNDINLFVTLFTDGVVGNADIDGDGDEDADDINAFVNAFVAGCN